MKKLCLPCQRRRGAALLAVLWVIALLIMLVGGASLLLMQDVDMASTRGQMFRARLLAETGLAIAMNPDVKGSDPLLHFEPLPGERYDVEITGEDGRLNPNLLLQREDRETLRRVLRYWGMDLVQADTLIDALLDWVDGDGFPRIRGAEAKAYGRSGLPFNRPFRSIEEMALVRGMQEVDAVYPRWRDWFSVHASGVVDVNEAQPEIISALTGADIGLAQQMRARRLGRDGMTNTLDDAPMPDLGSALQMLGLPFSQGAAYASILSVNSASRRIVVHSQVGEFKRELAVVVRGSPATGGAGGAIVWLAEK